MRKELPSNRTCILPTAFGLVTSQPVISQQRRGEPLDKGGGGDIILMGQPRASGMGLMLPCTPRVAGSIPQHASAFSSPDKREDVSGAGPQRLRGGGRRRELQQRWGSRRGERSAERPRTSPSQRLLSTHHHHHHLGYSLLPAQYNLPYATGESPAGARAGLGEPRRGCSHLWAA